MVDIYIFFSLNRGMKIIDVKENVGSKYSSNAISHLMAAYIDIKRDKSETEKKEIYFILFKITKMA